MAVNAYDVQVCLWKLVKLSSKICLNVSIEHPYALSSLLFMFFLYIFFPFVFRILMYSLPLVVSTCIILSISFSLRNNQKYKENDEGENGEEDQSKKPYNRVHSVRRRRAKEIVIEHNVEEKNAVSTTNFNCNMIDKTTLKEESPKEIREVEVDSIKQENDDEGPNRVRRLGILTDEDEDEEEANKVRQCHEDDHKNMEILDAERNKRLESLIARRRSRKLLSLQVRRSLLNKDRNDHNQIPSLVIPNISMKYSPNRFSPGPGSAPSVLIPMRNPFDLPYDPQEEKPVLTGDSFHQEFTSSNREMVYCRHESFTLGTSLSGGLYQNRRNQTSPIPNSGSRQRSFSTRFQFSKLKNQSPGSEFSPIKEQEQYEPSDSKSNANSLDDDQIKEVIQVHEIEQEGTDNEDESTRIPQSDFNSSSTSPSSSSSSAEDQPIFKIDREAILKSLSSMRRNTMVDLDNNDQIEDTNLSYANSALENASRLKQHSVSYSIASDLQVEVSEMSSPPLTIDENLSYDWEMERNDDMVNDGDYGNEDSYDNEQPLAEKHCIESKSSEESAEISEVSTTGDEPISSGEASVTQTVVGSNDSQQEQSLGVNVQSPITSPTSVLLPVPSLPSFDPYIDHGEATTPVALQDFTTAIEQTGDLPSSSGDGESSNHDREVHQYETHIGEVTSPIALQDSTPAIEQTGDLPCSSGDGESSKHEESTEPANTSTLEAVDTEFVDDNSEIVRTHEEIEQPKEETSSRSCTYNDEVFIKDLEAANSSDISQHIDHPDKLIPSMFTKEDDSSTTRNDDNQTENSTSNVLYGTEHELAHRDLDAQE